MPRAISFVAGDELAEWLRVEADRRALTVPATVQTLLAEAYHERDAGEATASRDSPAEQLNLDDDGTDLEALTDAVASQGVETDALDRNPETWTMVDRGGERFYAVDLPDGGRKFHSTRSGAAESVSDAYE